MLKFDNIFEEKGYGCVCISLPRMAFVAEIVIAPCGYGLVIIRAQLFLHRTFRMLFCDVVRA